MASKKKIDLEKIFHYSVFGTVIVCILTDNPNLSLEKRNIDQYARNFKNEDLQINCEGFVFEALYNYYIVLKPQPTAGLIAHEASHAISRMFSDRGIKADYNNDEIFAYFLGNLVDGIYPMIEAYKKAFPEKFEN
jgi:hypothetical protein